MKIQQITNYQQYPNKFSFGSCARFYKTSNGDEIGTNSWLFRDDVDWKRLAKYEKNILRIKTESI